MFLGSKIKVEIHDARSHFSTSNTWMQYMNGSQWIWSLKQGIDFELLLSLIIWDSQAKRCSKSLFYLIQLADINSFNRCYRASSWQKLLPSEVYTLLISLWNRARPFSKIFQRIPSLSKERMHEHWNLFHIPNNPASLGLDGLPKVKQLLICIACNHFSNWQRSTLFKWEEKRKLMSMECPWHWTNPIFLLTNTLI